MKEYKPHKLCELFPVISASEMTSLMRSVKAEGLHQPIVLFEGKILDGRHRFEACELADVEPRFVEYAGTDPIGFVISANLSRRHLTISERAVIAVKLATLKQGGDKQSESGKQTRNSYVGRTEAAKTLGVSTDTVNVAAKIEKQSPKLFGRISAGEITVHAAEKKLAETATPQAAAEGRKDGIGRTILEEILPDWDAAAAIATRLRSCASEIKVTLEKGINAKELAFAELQNHAVAEASTLHYSLSQIIPYALCPWCQGRARTSCTKCKRRGWISKYLFDSPNVTAEMRAILKKTTK